MVRSGPFGSSFPPRSTALRETDKRNLSVSPAFPCTSGTEAPFVQANRKGRCRLGPTPVLRRPTWAGKKDRTAPTEAAAISPAVAALAGVGARHRDVARGDGAAGSLVGATSLGGFGRVLSAGPCRTPQRGRRSEALPSPWEPPRLFRLAPARARQRRACGKFLLSQARSAVDLDRRKGPGRTRPS